LPKLHPRGWQVKALEAWERAEKRGIISVVTGGGKTVFALSCVDRVRPVATLIVVPTTALLEQWWEEAANYFDLELDEINIISGSLRFRLGTINTPAFRKDDTPLNRKPGGLMEQSNASLQRGDQG
jgi:superfamily II DNA or RNA helicase